MSRARLPGSPSSCRPRESASGPAIRSIGTSGNPEHRQSGQPGAMAGSGQQTPEPSPPVVLPPRVGVMAAPRALTLADAIRLTLEQNNDVTIARLEVDAARQDVRAAQGIFDPHLVPALTYQRVATPSTSTIGGGINGRVEQSLLGGTLQLAGRTPWAGGRYTADFTSSRTETSNVLSRLNPQFPSSLGASYVQPLGRGRSIDAERRQILLARKAVDLTDAQLTQIVMDQLTLVEQAYWDLAFADRNLAVQTQALAQAQGQVSSNERQAREGTLAPIDVVEAQTQVANFQQTVASAQQALTEAENRLKTLMLSGRDADIWNQALVPADLARIRGAVAGAARGGAARAVAPPGTDRARDRAGAERHRSRSTSRTSRSRRSTWPARIPRPAWRDRP